MNTGDTFKEKYGITREELRIRINNIKRKQLHITSNGASIDTQRQRNNKWMKNKRQQELNLAGFQALGIHQIKCTTCGKVTNKYGLIKLRHLNGCPKGENNG
jgi:hypothetical protein